jgi:rod shape determining protein RodA
MRYEELLGPQGTARRFDWLLFAVVLIICSLGVTFIWSASYHREDTGGWEPSAQPYYQIVWVVIGVAVFIALLVPSYTVFMRAAYPLYVLGILLLAGLYFAPKIKEVHRWYPVGPILFQPSEFMKVIMVVALARYLTYRENYRQLSGLIAPLLLTLLPTVLIVREPDLGTALIFLPVFFAMLYVAGAKRKHLVGIALIGLACLPLLYLYALRHYQQERLISFLNPEAYIQEGGYQIINAVSAIGSGGMLGKGWGAGTQNLYGFIPADQTDFIFAVLGEEWGFLGAIGLLLLYFMLFICGLSIARHTREPFGRLIAVGVVTMLAVQVFINIGMTVQLMPVTGLPLPFMSYGGSSLLSSFIALALLMNVGMRQVPVLADEDFK